MTKRHYVEIKKAAARHGCIVTKIGRTRHTHITVERGDARRTFFTGSTPDKINSAWLFEQDLKRWIRELESAGKDEAKAPRT